MSAQDSIDLAEFIWHVKRELMESTQREAAQPALLMVEDVELQIQVQVSRQADAKLNVQVVQLGGSGKRDDVHTIRVKLQPILGHDERVAALRGSPEWPQIEQAAVQHLTKDLADQQLTNQY